MVKTNQWIAPNCCEAFAILSLKVACVVKHGTNGKNTCRNGKIIPVSGRVLSVSMPEYWIYEGSKCVNFILKIGIN